MQIIVGVCLVSIECAVRHRCLAQQTLSVLAHWERFGTATGAAVMLGGSFDVAAETGSLACIAGLVWTNIQHTV